MTDSYPPMSSSPSSSTSPTPSSTPMLAVAPEDLLYACVAYTRDEMHAFDTIIAEHSTGSLFSSSSHQSTSTTLLDLPPELLLDVRTHLHRTLVSRTRTSAADALAAYEDALLRGLCSDCFWWNYDMHGPDVWEWIKNGYKEACQCNGGSAVRTATAVPAAPVEKPESVSEDGRSNGVGMLSAPAVSAASAVSPDGIATKRQWLDAFVDRTYGAECAWSELVPSVLSSLSCEISGLAESSPSADASFGPNVFITPLRADDTVALGRVTRELGLESVKSSLPSPSKENEEVDTRKRCTMRYAHQLLGQQLPAQQADYFQTHGHLSCACASCASLANAAAASSSSSSAPNALGTGAASSLTGCRNADVIAFLAAVDVSIRHASTLLSFAMVSSLLYVASLLAPRSWIAPAKTQRV